MEQSVANSTAKLQLADQTYELPVIVGSENEHAVDIAKLRADTGYITLDDGYGNTGSCQSAVTFINGEKGILRYRGIPIEQLAENSTFIETAYLLIYGELPSSERLERLRQRMTRRQMLHEDVTRMFQQLPATSHPMAVLGQMIHAISCHDPDLMHMQDQDDFDAAAAALLSQVRMIAAATYKRMRGEPVVYPASGLNYAQNFLHMMFSRPFADYHADPDVVNALQLFLILHADHEQNCSTSTVRMVASSGANMLASCSAGVSALWGWKHGGANVAVIEMLQSIHDGDVDAKGFLEKVRNRQAKLMGFGHRVYKSYDPRAKILKSATDKVLAKLDIDDPLLEIARQLEETALSDDYFIERNLYPNVDFYSGIMLRAIGIPVDMFTVMFAIGRMPGWIAHFKEVWDADSRIYRPRQVYTGPTERDYATAARQRH